MHVLQMLTIIDEDIILLPLKHFLSLSWSCTLGKFIAFSSLIINWFHLHWLISPHKPRSSFLWAMRCFLCVFEEIVEKKSHEIFHSNSFTIHSSLLISNTRTWLIVNGGGIWIGWGMKLNIVLKFLSHKFMTFSSSFFRLMNGTRKSITLNIFIFLPFEDDDGIVCMLLCFAYFMYISWKHFSEIKGCLKKALRVSFTLYCVIWACMHWDNKSFFHSLLLWKYYYVFYC